VLNLHVFIQYFFKVLSTAFMTNHWESALRHTLTNDDQLYSIFLLFGEERKTAVYSISCGLSIWYLQTVFGLI